MKAAVFHAQGKITCDTVDDPKIEDQNGTCRYRQTDEICGNRTGKTG